MPPQPVIPKWVRVVARLSHESNTMLVGLDFRPNADGPYTGPQLSNLLTDMWTAIGTSFLNCMTASWSIAALEATDRSVVGGAFATYTPSPVVGTRAGDSTPANVALVLSKRTGFSGRRNHGRLYMPGASDVDVVGSIASNTYMLALNALGVALLNYAGTTGLPGGWAFPSVTDLTMKLITGIAADAVVDSQRRRLPGRGY